MSGVVNKVIKAIRSIFKQPSSFKTLEDSAPSVKATTSHPVSEKNESKDLKNPEKPPIVKEEFPPIQKASPLIENNLKEGSLADNSVYETVAKYDFVAKVSPDQKTKPLEEKVSIAREEETLAFSHEAMITKEEVSTTKEEIITDFTSTQKIVPDEEASISKEETIKDSTPDQIVAPLEPSSTKEEIIPETTPEQNTILSEEKSSVLEGETIAVIATEQKIMSPTEVKASIAETVIAPSKDAEAPTLAQIHAASTIEQRVFKTIKPHVPLIKFRKGGIPASVNASNSSPTDATAEIPSPNPLKSQVYSLEWWQTPSKYKRRLIDELECDAINSGGGDKLWH